MRNYIKRSCLNKAVDSHDGHIWLTLGIVHQVQVHKLLELQVISLHAVHNIWEKRAGKPKCANGLSQGDQNFIESSEAYSSDDAKAQT